MVRVVVIGGGPCGLVTLKEMLEAGHDAECFESKDYIGGVFGADPDAAYDGLYLTTSNVFMAYSDFPCKDAKIRYSRKDEYAQYLVDYAEAFGLMKRLTLKTTVDSAVRKDGKWAVVTTTAGGDRVHRTYDAVVCCTGANQCPKLPLADVLKDYHGEVLHSSDYQNNAAFAGKKVLVVGIGESAADIATEISWVASCCTAWSRRPVMYAPRFLEQSVEDGEHDEYAVMNDSDVHLNVTEFLEFATTTRASVMQACWQYGGVRQVGWGLGQYGLGPAGKNNKQFIELSRASKECTTGKGARIFWQADQAGWVTKNSRMCREVAKGNVKYIVAKSIDKVDGTKLTFANGATADVDVVMCCTGYKQDYPWLQEDIGCRCPRSWYKHSIPACFDEKKIAFVGYARGHQGGIPQMGEMQARLLALTLAGGVKLPADHAARAKVEAKAEDDYYPLCPQLKPLVDYPSYMDSLARIIGCEPDVPWFSPTLLFKYVNYPLWPAWYRLAGPGANKSAAMQVFDQFPIKKWWALNPLYVVSFVNYLCTKVISLLCWPFVPNTGVDKYGLFMWVRPKHFALHGLEYRFRDIFRP